MESTPLRQIAPLPLPPSQLAPAPSETVSLSRTAENPILQVVAQADFLTSRTHALKAVSGQWDVREPVITEAMTELDNESFFRISARSIEMETLKVEADLRTIRNINLPAILEISLQGNGGTRFVAILSIENEVLWLSDNLEPFAVSPELLDEFWNGTAYVPWKNFYNYTGIIPMSSPGDVIVSLKVHLKRLGFPMEQMNGAYDTATRRAIERIQSRNGLAVDGIVGPMTKIVLYNEDRLLTIPRLTGTPKE
jgi:general secretion pathway protein A